MRCSQLVVVVTVVVVCVTAAVGCKKSDQPAGAGSSAATGSGASGSGSAVAGSTGSNAAGSGVAGTDAAVAAMVADMMAYTEQVVPLMLAFDGDCAAQAKRMLVLEPIATRIRAQGAALESDPARVAAFKAAMELKRPELMAQMKAKLGAAGTTEVDVDRKDKDINAKCGSDPAYVDAMQHVGLRKKKH
jgi:hypothetical protein